MKLNEVMSAIEEWENKLKEAQTDLENAQDWEDACYNRVLLYERECDAHPESEHLLNILMNEVYPNYDGVSDVRRKAEEKFDSAERVLETLKELKEAMEEWQGV